MLNEAISNETKTNISTLIESIRQEIKNENLESLKIKSRRFKKCYENFSRSKNESKFKH